MSDIGYRILQTESVSLSLVIHIPHGLVKSVVSTIQLALNYGKLFNYHDILELEMVHLVLVFVSF
jgi:hypothetical protein